MKYVEIERKWLMSGFPEMPYEKEIIQVQGYLSFEPSTVRIRKTQDAGQEKYVLTIKGKGTLSRAEVEFDISANEYFTLQDLLIAPTVQKRLRLYRLPNGHMLECSLVDENETDAFYYGEIEFESEEEANNYLAPPWFGKELTEKKAYSMAARSRKKLMMGGNF